jgi:hypothetical protein
MAYTGRNNHAQPITTSQQLRDVLWITRIDEDLAAWHHFPTVQIAHVMTAAKSTEMVHK